MDKRERPVSSLRSGFLSCLSDSQDVEEESYPYADSSPLTCFRRRIFEIISLTVDIFSYFLKSNDLRGDIS